MDMSLEEKELSKHARVHAADSTSTKVSGLSVLVREHNVDMLVKELQNNHNTCKPSDFVHSFDKLDFEDCAVDLEYSVFTTKTNMTMYRSALVKLVSNFSKLMFVCVDVGFNLLRRSKCNINNITFKTIFL